MYPSRSLDRPWYRGNPRARAVLVSLFALLAAALTVSAGTLDQIKSLGKLKLGYRSDARPFSYRDESGHAAGYSVTLCQRIAEQMKAELGLPALGVEWVPVTAGRARCRTDLGDPGARRMTRAPASWRLCLERNMRQGTADRVHVRGTERVANLVKVDLVVNP